jgi:hypothetical protein
MHALSTLKSEDDRRLYLEHLVKEHGEGYALDLVRMVGISAQIERDARESSAEVFDRAYNEHTEEILRSLHSDEEEELQQTPQEQKEEVHHSSMNLRYLLAYKDQVKEDVERLKVLKKAA